MNPILSTPVDPNPREIAECALVVRCLPFETFDGDRLLGSIVMLYDRQASFALICKAMDDLTNNNEALLYVGSRATCERWAPDFVDMGLRVEISEL